MRRTSVPCPSLIAGRALRRGCGRARGRKVRRTRLRAWSLQRPWPPSCEVCAAAMGARSAASMAARRGRGPYRSARCRCGEVQFAVGTRSAAANAVVARGPVRHGLMAAVVARFARCGCARLRQHARWCVFCSMWAVLLVQHRRSSRVRAVPMMISSHYFQERKRVININRNHLSQHIVFMALFIKKIN